VTVEYSAPSECGNLTRRNSWILLPLPTPSSVQVPSLPIPSTLKIAASSNG